MSGLQALNHLNHVIPWPEVMSTTTFRRLLNLPEQSVFQQSINDGIYQSNFLNHNSLVSLSNLAWFNGIFHGKIQHRCHGSARFVPDGNAPAAAADATAASTAAFSSSVATDAWHRGLWIFNGKSWEINHQTGFLLANGV